MRSYNLTAIQPNHTNLNTPICRVTSVLIIVIILVGAYFVDVYKLYLRKLMDEVVLAIYINYMD